MKKGSLPLQSDALSKLQLNISGPSCSKCAVCWGQIWKCVCALRVDLQKKIPPPSPPQSIPASVSPDDLFTHSIVQQTQAHKKSEHRQTQRLLNYRKANTSG